MKKCNVCNIIKNKNEFYSNGFKKNGEKKFKPLCNRCFTIVRFKRHWDRIKKIVGNIECSKCGYDTNLTALEFHHIVGNKKYEVNHFKTHSVKNLKKEINKCILLCANCHRDEHNKNKRKEIVFG